MKLQNMFLEYILGNKLYLFQKQDVDICICYINELSYINNKQLKNYECNVGKILFFGVYFELELYIKIIFDLDYVFYII